MMVCAAGGPFQRPMAGKCCGLAMLVVVGFGLTAFWKSTVKPLLRLRQAMADGNIFEYVWLTSARTEAVTTLIHGSIHGVLSKLTGGPTGQAFSLNDANMVEEYSAKESHHFKRHQATPQDKVSFRCILGAGSGADHHRMRSEMAKYYAKLEFKKLKPKMHEVIFAAAEFIAKQPQPVDLERFMSDLVVDLHLLVIFGKPGGCVQGQSKMGSMIMGFLERPAKLGTQDINSPEYQEILKAVEQLRRDSPAVPGTVMHMLRGLVSVGKITEDELMANIMLFLIALAPAAACTWAICHMVFHGHIGKARENKSFLARCLQETLRITPAVPTTPHRVAESDTQIGNLLIRKGDWVFLSQAYTHHREESWDNPDIFDPYRWPEDTVVGVEAGGKDHGLRFFPFGFGRHRCMGMELAKTQMRAILRSVLALCNFEISARRNPAASINTCRFRQHVYGFPDAKVMVKITSRAQEALHRKTEFRSSSDDVPTVSLPLSSLWGTVESPVAAALRRTKTACLHGERVTAAKGKKTC